MRRLTYGIGTVILALVCLISAHAQSCEDSSTLQKNDADTGLAGSDGLIHVTFSFVDASGNPSTPAANIQSAVTQAVSEWNALSSSSGVQFDPAPPGQPSNIQIQSTTDASGNTGGCAAYSANTGRVYYGQTFQQASTNISIGATIIAHEFGHALGLADGGANPNPPSIMNNPTNPPPYACTSPNVPTTAPQATDAAKSKTCSIATHNLMRIQGHTDTSSFLGNVTYTTPSETCTYEYYTEYYYVDGEPAGSEQYVAAINCTD